jgi:hypothetical protein
MQLPYRSAASAALFTAFAVLPTTASTPLTGKVYFNQYTAGHGVFEASFQYDGTSFVLGTPRLLTQLPTGAGMVATNDGSLIVAGQGAYCGGCAYKVNIETGATQSIIAGNNNNHLSLSTDGTRAFLGWKDTAFAEVSVQPFAPLFVHNISGDDGAVTQAAFLPDGRAFYVTGGEDRWGNFGSLDMSNFSTHRYLSSLPATGVVYDEFSDSLLISAFDRITQVRPDAPGVVLSTLTLPRNFCLALASDHRGHLMASYDNFLTFIDYSASGLIGDTSTVALFIPAGISYLAAEPTMVVEATNTCIGDFNSDGGVDGQDVDAFFTAWAAGGSEADVNADGGVDGGDVSTFFQHWETGC